MPGNDSLTRRRIADEIDKIADDVGLGERGSYAHQRATDAARSDELTYELAAAARRLDYAERTEYDAEPETDVDVLDALDDVDEQLRTRVEEVARDAVDAEVGGHSVDLRHARHEVCPSSGEVTDPYSLGTASTEDGEVAGWVRGHCEEETEEIVDDRRGSA
jgi:hypothetical protein